MGFKEISFIAYPTKSEKLIKIIARGLVDEGLIRKDFQKIFSYVLTLDVMKKRKAKLKRFAPMTKMLNGKRVHVCDYHGTCTNKAYKEVYPMLIGKSSWNYLCRNHFEQERKKLKGKLPYCCIIEKFK